MNTLTSNGLVMFTAWNLLQYSLVQSKKCIPKHTNQDQNGIRGRAPPAVGEKCARHLCPQTFIKEKTSHLPQK